MIEALSFDDVLIVPQFSEIASRRDVDLSTKIGFHEFKLPIISSNMDTVTENTMAQAMVNSGGVGCLHRFMTIEQNVAMYKKSPPSTWCSIGLGENEYARAVALVAAGCSTLVIDVAHGASLATVEQYNKLFNYYKTAVNLVVGNFAQGYEIEDFLRKAVGVPTAFKVGIGGGSACTTRIKTGCGMPTFESIRNCGLSWKMTPVTLIADGGMRTPGDIAKALAAGASAVMLGGMLAGTEESPGESNLKEKRTVRKYSDETQAEFLKRINLLPNEKILVPHGWLDGVDSAIVVFEMINKTYRGSASKESYDLQGKSDDWRTAEGESFLVDYKGPVAKVLQDIEGGVRSAFSYVGAKNLKEFQERAGFIKITQAGVKESGAHGKTS